MPILKAVLPVAGLGTRFLPATKAQPKEMLPVVDKPLVQYAVEEVAASGVPLVIFVTGRGKDSIERHFDVSQELEEALVEKGKVALRTEIHSISESPEIAYVRQKQPAGLGDAILRARHLVGNEPFAVLLPDDLVDAREPCLKQMIRVFERYGSSIVAIQRVNRKAVSSYGIIKGRLVRDHGWSGRLYRIDDMVEKPAVGKAPTNLAIIGRYILTPAVFDELAKTKRGAGGEIQLTDALCGLLAREPVFGFIFQGKRYDAGDKLGFLKATIEMALKRPDLGKPLWRYLKSLRFPVDQV